MGEMLRGALNDPEMAGQSFFDFSDPQYAQSRGGGYQAENATLAGRQTALKQ